MVEDPQIYQLAYRLFLEEVPGLLETIERELLDLENNSERALKVNNLMRAVHTIKGGAANVQLELIEGIAHRLEDVLRGLYAPDLTIDSSLKSLLFDSYEYLELLLSAKVENTNINEREIIKLAAANLDRLEARLKDYLDDNSAFPTSEELGLDPVKIFFETVVTERLEIISAIINTPDNNKIIATLSEQAIIFRGMGRSFNLTDLVAIAENTLTALDRSPKLANDIAKTALKDFQKIHDRILKDSEESATNLIQSPDILEEENISLSELLTELAIFIEPQNREFYLKIIKCIFGWFHRYENINLTELNLNFIVPIELLEKTPELEQYIDTWLNKFLQYLELMNSQPSLNLYRQFTTLQAILAVIKFQYYRCFNEIATTKKLPIIEKFTGKVAKLKSEYNNFRVDLKGTDWLNYSYIKDLIKAIDNFTTSALEDIWEDSKPLELFSTPVSESKIDEPEQNVSEEIEITETKKESNIKLEKEKISSTVKVKIEEIEKINYLAGELAIEQNKNALNNQESQAIIEDILAKNKQTQQLLNQLCNWFDLALMFPDNSNFFETFSHLFPKIPLKDFNYSSNNGNSSSLQIEQYQQIFKILKIILEDTNDSVKGLEKVKNYGKKFAQSFKKKQRMLFNMRAELIEARMTPLSNLFNRFPRLIEQLSNTYNKQVELKLSGANILVDKAIEQKLYQPLLHLIRNAFAHGIETPENRLKKGKLAKGSIEIAAYYQGSKTIVAVKDDGQGINLDKIKKRAIESNLISPQKAKTLSESQTLEYLFEPGFSTTSEVDLLSGRGLGLDIVRAQLEALKGNIVVESKLQQGTSFYLQIPLTLSIAKLMVCEAGGIIYSIVSDLVQKILQPQPNQIEFFQQQKILHLNSETEKYAIPVYKLSELIRYSNSLEKKLEQKHSYPSPIAPILLLNQNDSFLGLEVDRVLGKQELVIRSLGSALTPPRFVYGCSILSNSNLSLVIDGIALIEEMGKQKHTVTKPTDAIASPQKKKLPTLPPQKIILPQSIPHNSQVLLIVDDSITSQHTTTTMLKKAGYKIIQVKDGVAALEKLYEAEKINLIICDLDMPRMNGFEFLKSLSQNPQLNLIPAIVLTSNNSQTYQDLALQLGASAFLSKPCTEQNLLDTVARLLFSPS